MRSRTTPLARELIATALRGELDEQQARRLAELGAEVVALALITHGTYNVGRGLQRFVDAFDDTPTPLVPCLPGAIGKSIGGETGETIGEVVELVVPPPTTPLTAAKHFVDVVDFAQEHSPKR